MSKCRICGDVSAVNNAFWVSEMMYGMAETFLYFQCSSCSCLQIAEIPSDLGQYYKCDYYSFKTYVNSGGIKGELKRRRNAYAVLNEGVVGHGLYAAAPRLDLRFLSRIRLTRQSHVLDVGCGSGRLLATLEDLGFTNLTGIDPYIAEDLAIAGKVRIYKRTLEQCNQRQDLIMFNHSLEHMPDQLAELGHAARLIGDDGIITVSVPIVARAWELYRENWVQLDAPRHLYLHSPKSLRILAANVGLDVAEVFFDSTAFQFWGSEQCRRGISLLDQNSFAVNPNTQAFSRKEIRHFKRLSRQYNRDGVGDQATFILRRKHVKP